MNKFKHFHKSSASAKNCSLRLKFLLSDSKKLALGFVNLESRFFAERRLFLAPIAWILKKEWSFYLFSKVNLMSMPTFNAKIKTLLTLVLLKNLTCVWLVSCFHGWLFFTFIHCQVHFIIGFHLFYYQVHSFLDIIYLLC